MSIIKGNEKLENCTLQWAKDRRREREIEELRNLRPWEPPKTTRAEPRQPAPAIREPRSKLILPRGAPPQPDPNRVIDCIRSRQQQEWDEKMQRINAEDPPGPWAKPPRPPTPDEQRVMNVRAAKRAAGTWEDI